MALLLGEKLVIRILWIAFELKLIGSCFDAFREARIFKS